MVAWACRYGKQPLSEVLSMEGGRLRLFRRALRELVKEEMA